MLYDVTVTSAYPINNTLSSQTAANRDLMEGVQQLGKEKGEAIAACNGLRQELANMSADHAREVEFWTRKVAAVNREKMEAQWRQIWVAKTNSFEELGLEGNYLTTDLEATAKKLGLSFLGLHRSGVRDVGVQVDGGKDFSASQNSAPQKSFKDTGGSSPDQLEDYGVACLHCDSPLCDFMCLVSFE